MQPVATWRSSRLHKLHFLCQMLVFGINSHNKYIYIMCFINRTSTWLMKNVSETGSQHQIDCHCRHSVQMRQIMIAVVQNGCLKNIFTSGRISNFELNVSAQRRSLNFRDKNAETNLDAENYFIFKLTVKFDCCACSRDSLLRSQCLS